MYYSQWITTSAKLVFSNYTFWSVKTCTYLKACNLWWDVVEKPGSSRTTKIQENKNEQALKILQKATHPDVWKHVEGINCPSQVWKILELISTKNKCQSLPIEYWVQNMDEDLFRLEEEIVEEEKEETEKVEMKNKKLEGRCEENVNDNVGEDGREKETENEGDENRFRKEREEEKGVVEKLEIVKVEELEKDEGEERVEEKHVKIKFEKMRVKDEMIKSLKNENFENSKNGERIVLKEASRRRYVFKQFHEDDSAKSPAKEDTTIEFVEQPQEQPPAEDVEKQTDEKSVTLEQSEFAYQLQQPFNAFATGMKNLKVPNKYLCVENFFFDTGWQNMEEFFVQGKENMKVHNKLEGQPFAYDKEIIKSSFKKRRFKSCTATEIAMKIAAIEGGGFQ